MKSISNLSGWSESPISYAHADHAACFHVFEILVEFLELVFMGSLRDKLHSLRRSRKKYAQLDEKDKERKNSPT